MVAADLALALVDSAREREHHHVLRGLASNERSVRALCASITNSCRFSGTSS